MPSDEAAIAAKWWADCLREPGEVRHDAGDAYINAVTNAIADTDSRNAAFESAAVDEFERATADRIQQQIDDYRETWDYQRPHIGSTTIRCDYHVHPLLQEAADEAGLEISSMTTFPVKTTMQIAPGEVRVSSGYQAEFETIWEIGEYRDEIADRVADWTYPTPHPERNVTFEPEPKVYPLDDGYRIRAYGEYSPERYGPVVHEFKITTEAIEADGLSTVLDAVAAELETVRAEVAEYNG